VVDQSAKDLRDHRLAATIAMRVDGQQDRIAPPSALDVSRLQIVDRVREADSVRGAPAGKRRGRIGAGKGVPACDVARGLGDREVWTYLTSMDNCALSRTSRSLLDSCSA
jgi:hypothetical protein